MNVSSATKKMPKVSINKIASDTFIFHFWGKAI